MIGKSLWTEARTARSHDIFDTLRTWLQMHTGMSVILLHDTACDDSRCICHFILLFFFVVLVNSS